MDIFKYLAGTILAISAISCIFGMFHIKKGKFKLLLFSILLLASSILCYSGAVDKIINTITNTITIKHKEK